MPIEETPFSESIYTRRDKFNHEYDITLNEISNNSNKKGFSNFGYCYCNLYNILNLDYHLNKNSKQIFFIPIILT